MIEEHGAEIGVRELCEALGESRTSLVVYYTSHGLIIAKFDKNHDDGGRAGVL